MSELREFTPFELSRMYAKGWTAGMSFAVEEADEALRERAEALNPCTGDAARARWTQGFLEAIQRKTATPKRKRPGNAAAGTAP